MPFRCSRSAIHGPGSWWEPGCDDWENLSSEWKTAETNICFVNVNVSAGNHDNISLVEIMMEK